MNDEELTKEEAIEESEQRLADWKRSNDASPVPITPLILINLIRTPKGGVYMNVSDIMTPEETIVILKWAIENVEKATKKEFTIADLLMGLSKGNK